MGQFCNSGYKFVMSLSENDRHHSLGYIVHCANILCVYVVNYSLFK